MYDEIAAYFEVNHKIVENNSLRGNSRKEIGLKEFEVVEIRSVVMGIDVTITQKITAKILGVSYVGRCTLNTKETSPKVEVIKTRLFEYSEDFGRLRT